MKEQALLMDIGGTKTELVFRAKKEILLNKNFSSFEELLSFWLKKEKLKENQIGFLGLAVAGPVKKRTCQMTNLAWFIDLEKIKDSFFPHMDDSSLLLLNDLQAAAWSLLRERDLLARKDNFAIISAGTGLGAAYGFYQEGNEKWLITPSEAGHILKDESDSSWEDALSGAGLLESYGKATGKSLENTKELSQLARQGDKEALDVINIYFLNLAKFAQMIGLLALPRAGIYLSGGIISNFYSFTDKEAFRRAFKSNPQMKEILQEIPLYLAHPSAPLLGLEELFSSLSKG